MIAFSKFNINFGVVSNGFHFDQRPSVHICSIGSMKSKLKYLKTPNLIVWDECHHQGATTWENLYKQYPSAFHIGLTATPIRLDGKGLRKYYQDIILGPTVKWLIENKSLSEYKYFAPHKVNTESLHTAMGDYKKSEVESLMSDRAVVGDAVKEYKKFCMNKRAVVFCASVKHSQLVCEYFNAAGIKAAHLDGTTDKTIRDRCIEDLAAGRIKVLCNADIISEGFDIPSIDAAILLRPTQSLGLYLQQVGRALRPYPGKEYAIILDHVGNYERHGLPDDDREWSLDGINKKQTESVPSIKICPQCFGAIRFFPCGNCGHTPQIKKREPIKQIEGDLQEVSKEQLRKQFKKDQGRAQTLDELIALGKSRGYKKAEAWAYYVFKSRLSKRR